MSEWHCETVVVGSVEKHPNADSLSITNVHGGYPVIFKTGDFKEGDTAIYIPVDSVMPNVPQFHFLQSSRIKARKIRGIFSQGLLLNTNVLPQGTHVVPGMIVHELLDIHKWEPKEERKWSGGMTEAAPENFTFVKYTDLEGLRRYKNVIEEGTEVVITEKEHGSNGRFMWDGDRLWVGSRNEIKKRDSKTLWWQVVESLGIEEKLKAIPNVIFFGEVYGKGVQDLSYDLDEVSFIVFDTFDVNSMRYNDWNVSRGLALQAGFNLVPVLYHGPWLGFVEHAHLAEGKSTIANHVREGFVVKPVIEQWNQRIGRVILKLIGQGFLLRNDS